jgi:hypothetical protein
MCVCGAGVAMVTQTAEGDSDQVNMTLKCCIRNIAIIAYKSCGAHIRRRHTHCLPVLIS